MIWIIGEYADRIENADELLESFLEAFPEETSAVQLQLVTATVKLFLKRPTERVQQMIQLVLTFATQVGHGPFTLCTKPARTRKKALFVVKSMRPRGQLVPALINLQGLSRQYHDA